MFLKGLALHPATHFDFEIGAHLLEELLRGHPRLIRSDQNREILGHMAVFNSLDAHFLKRFCKTRYIRRFVKFATEFQTASPCED